MDTKRTSVSAKRLSPNPMEESTKRGLKIGAGVVVGGLAIVTGLFVVGGLLMAKEYKKASSNMGKGLPPIKTPTKPVDPMPDGFMPDGFMEA
jgi:hypothetical protein